MISKCQDVDQEALEYSTIKALQTGDVSFSFKREKITSIGAIHRFKISVT